jgi:TATA-box binding protein (TBP) (component of TFIID and TFIIIB)
VGIGESQDHMKDLSIVNVVGGGSICRELDLLQVSQDFPHSEVEYNPDSFAAVVIRYIH